MTSTSRYKTVLFDLDGTLLDTAPDLADALNQVLVNHEQQALPFDFIRPVVSHGGMGLIKRGFNIEAEHPDFESLRQELLDVYEANLAVKTRLFEGMDQVLDRFEADNIQWGVVTNKPGWLTEPLMQALQLFDRACCVVSGDTLPQRKPDPAPLLHACKLSNSSIEDCIYIGDAERDIEAGRRAGMHTMVALFGYLGIGDAPDKWQADIMVNHPLEILEHIYSQANYNKI